jgi:hypothetical protein
MRIEKQDIDRPVIKISEPLYDAQQAFTSVPRIGQQAASGQNIYGLSNTE